MSTNLDQAGYFLRSERLGFRHWRMEDRPLAEALWGDPLVMRYIGGPLEPLAAHARMQSEMLRQGQLGLQYWPILFARNRGTRGLRRAPPAHL